jgi:Kip1 ubiquitination-promoting complex protein 1
LSSDSKHLNADKMKDFLRESQEDMLALDVRATSGFVSIRANTAVFKEAYYYEVTLMTDGLMQIGWCTITTPFNSSDGVGDGAHSYAYDGFRVKKWNAGQSDYGEAWSAGDVIGTMINFKTKEVHFWRNGKHLGVAFRNIKVGPNMAYAPGISLSKGQRAKFNFGQRPFHLKLNECLLSLDSPDCVVNNFQATGQDILEILQGLIP